MKTKHTIMAIIIAALACVAFTAPQALITIGCAALIGGAGYLTTKSLRTVGLANTWTDAVQTHAGMVQRTAGAAIGTPCLLVMKGATDLKVIICDNTKPPLGVTDEATYASGDSVNVHLLGGAPTTRKLIANAAIAAGGKIYSDATGKVGPTPTATGTYYYVGQSLTAAAADGDVIEAQTSTPILVKVVANGASLATTQAAMTGGIVIVL
jgi:hypothetical protein